MSDFRDIVGTEGLDPDEEARLRRVHDLLVQAGPPPDLPPALERTPEAPIPGRPHFADVAANVLDGLLVDQVSADVRRMLAINSFTSTGRGSPWSAIRGTARPRSWPARSTTGSR